MRASSPLELLTRIAPPGEESIPTVKDLANGAQVWGPFPVGAQVRVSTALGACWYLAGDENVGDKLVVREAGAPIAAWDHREHTVTSERVRYVAIAKDTDASEAYGVAFRTGQHADGCPR